jgi:hypothetical protein
MFKNTKKFDFGQTAQKSPPGGFLKRAKSGKIYN